MALCGIPAQLDTPFVEENAIVGIIRIADVAGPEQNPAVHRLQHAVSGDFGAQDRGDGHVCFGRTVADA